MLALAAGCNGTAEQPASNQPLAAKNQSLRIAVIPKGTTHEFWHSVHAGAEQAAQEAGNVEIIWKAALKEDEREQQINLVDDFVVQHVDGICLAPLDSQALVAPVQAAKQAGIPTIIFDSNLDDADSPVSYVATDNYHSGVLAAERLAEVLQSAGDVILMRYNPGSESTLEREEGFLATLKEKYPKINVLSSNQYAGTTPEQALDNCQQMLLKYRDEVDGVFTVCEPNSTGMLGALDNAGLAGKVHFIAFDPNARLIEAMADGKIDGIVVQDPVNMGYLAMKAMLDHLQGKPVERTINTGEHMATPENMHTPQMEKLLHPVKVGE
ncbi:MAG TPA: substrate-binding domain-containing protein [Pirellulales bacterium]|nr:substrate-binding domain-containing protein [Pirellulales bacterium]